ncbi:hypothetical protein [Cystobacter ferrugineus]|uniref:Transmembrane protein n=1 Tax=Cystobacter ferrugineus TaxID=83449 RepID=A0A1L9BFH2_9BACT|nr:hypothetical protein [Cystobacter ferrugineus]OJH41009.1 hypothetical protein BON30_08870 [Cystobacter ferrugineus]
MLHRLYLSAFWLLAAFGVLVTGGVALVQAHDHVVVAEERSCFLAEKARFLGAADTDMPKSARPDSSDGSATESEHSGTEAHLQATATNRPSKNQDIRESYTFEELIRMGGKIVPDSSDGSATESEHSGTEAHLQATATNRPSKNQDIRESYTFEELIRMGGKIVPDSTASEPFDRERESRPTDSWRQRAGLTEIPKCHISRWSEMGEPWDLGRYYTSRAWSAGTLTFTARADQIALSAISFVPLVMLVLLRRWIRWLRFGSVNG